MDTDLRYDGDKPYGLTRVYDFAAWRLNHNITKCILVGTPAVSAIAAGAYTFITSDYSSVNTSAMGLGGIVGFVAGLGITTFTTALTHDFNMGVKCREFRDSKLIKNYESHLETFIKTGTLPEESHLEFNAGISVDAIPYFVNNFDSKRLEGILKSLDGTSFSELLYSSWLIPTKSQRQIGYNYLLDLLPETDLEVSQVTSLFADSTCRLKRSSQSQLDESLHDYKRQVLETQILDEFQKRRKK